MDKEGKQKYLIERVKFIMDMLETPWFYCFGKVQEYILTRGMELDLAYDIDLGVIGGKVDIGVLKNAWESNGYKLKSEVINDVTGDPLNMHFVASEFDMKGTPSIDLYVWTKIGKRLYHTYDVNKEGSKIPREYVFKGVPAKFLVPDREEVEFIHKRDETMTEHGTWDYSMFGQYSGYSIRLPFAYGSLLDIWYPGWCFKRKGNFESTTPYIIKTRTCAKLCEQ